MHGVRQFGVTALTRQKSQLGFRTCSAGVIFTHPMFNPTTSFRATLEWEQGFDCINRRL
jgi:hypothetical protein